MRNKYKDGSLVLGCPECDFEAPEEQFPHLVAGSFPMYGFELVWETIAKVRCPGCGAIVHEDNLEEVLE